MTLTASEFLKHMEVPNEPRVYLLGCLEKRLTIYSQQVRALNLIHALTEARVLSSGTRIAVVGAGIAGLTAAAGALMRGYQVSLFEEKAKPLWLQWGCDKRWIHPRIYDWPAEGSLDGDASDMEVLPWTAGTAATVTQSLLNQWVTLAESFHSPILNIHMSIYDIDIVPWTAGDTRRLHWGPGYEGADFDVVILAVGFGIEKTVAPLPEQSYWRDERLAQDDISDGRRYLISGTGDGGLTDLLRACIQRFNHHQIVIDFHLDPEKNPDAKRLAICLKDIEEGIRPTMTDEDVAKYITDAYRSKDVDTVSGFVDKALADRLNKKRKVVLNGSSYYAFSPQASILNRYLASRLLKLRAADYWAGKISEGAIQKRADGTWVATIAGKSRQFEEIIIRHGTNAALDRGFPKVADECRPVIQPRNALDQTRTRRWTAGWFRSGKGSAIISSEQHSTTPSTIQSQPFGERDAYRGSEQLVLDAIGRLLHNRLDKALRSFSTQPIIWVDPVLSKTNEISRNANDNVKNVVSVESLLPNPKSTIIKAPPQFGLTCLAHFLIKEAWCKHSSFWLYIDSNEIKSIDRIDRKINSDLQDYGVTHSHIGGIIIDSWTNYEKLSFKILKKFSEDYKDIPMIVMQTIEDSKFSTECNSETIERPFEVLHLLAMPRGQIRKIVSAYNNKVHIGDEDAIMTKVVSDLEVLNMHRTPLNCLTLLKVSEKYFDESPVNRNEMIKMVLFVLFNLDSIPTYKTRPDLKDCEYVLGRFCETMMRTGNYAFSREHFLKLLKAYCTERVMDLEVEVVFDVLHINNIIVKRESLYGFRFSYWIYYFAAQRMQHDRAFADYIFEDMRYASYPAIIEFYTGIDRVREDALRILLKNLKETRGTVRNKVGLPDDMNPYRLAQWIPNDESLAKMQAEISEEVLKSKLPDSVKDQYADRQYDPLRPYNQNIQQIFQDYSLAILTQTIRAASRALRNSDYVEPEVKRELLKEIIFSWEEVGKVLLVLTPILAIHRQATFEGWGIYLDNSFDDDMEKRLAQLIQSIPYNIVSMFKHDLFSPKMGPLLYDQLRNEPNELKRHELILLLIFERPRDWKTHVQNYIATISKNSFYLLDLFRLLMRQYKFSFASPATLRDIEYLIKMVLAKHEFGDKKPGPEKIIKISSKVLPIREIDFDEETSTK